MCGIVGIFHYAEPDRPIDRDLLARMTHAIAHRGPDGEGFYIKDNLGFGHRRLSIVDLSPTGAQPMSNEDGTCWITYNGEFYNHASFRDRLSARGHRFRGPADTETLLHLMEEAGPEALSEATGIFGFAFWNSRTHRLTLALSWVAEPSVQSRAAPKRWRYKLRCGCRPRAGRVVRRLAG